MYKSLLILCLGITFNLFGLECSKSETNFRVETYMGQDIEAHAQELVGFISKIYSAAPYFNSIDIPTYVECMKYFAQSQNVIYSVAYDNETLVGLASGIAMNEMPDFYKATFIDKGLSTDTLYYIGDLGVDPAYKGCRLGKKLCLAIENFAKAKNFKTICKWTLDTTSTDKSSRYALGRYFWKKRGYAANQDMTFEMPWKNIGEDSETLHKGVYIFKDLK